VEGSCEHGNEPSGSIKCWEVLEWLHSWQLLEKDPVPEVGMPVEIRPTFRRNVSLHSTLKMYVTCASETSVDFQRTIRSCVPEYRNLRSHRFENLSSYLGNNVRVFLLRAVVLS
jgi:hypothetical protein